MALQFPKKPIWLAANPVDFRKAIDGLCSVVIDAFDQHPQESIFVFYNKARDKLKILVWDENGFIMVYKRISKRKFTIPKNLDAAKCLLDHQELNWLMQGVDWMIARENNSINYQYFC